MRLADNPIFVREGWPGKWAHRSPALRVGALVLFMAASGVVAWLSLLWSKAMMEVFSNLFGSLGRMGGPGNPPPFTPHQAAMLGAFTVFGWITGIKWWALRVLAAVVPAMAITPERERLTWDQVVLSVLPPRDILLGKWLSRLVPCLWVLLFFLPAEIVLVNWLSGREMPPQFQQAYGWLPHMPLAVGFGIEWVLQALAVVSYSAIALTWSLRSRRSINAVVGSVFTIMAVGIVSIIVAFLLMLVFGYFHEFLTVMGQAMTTRGMAPPTMVGAEAMMKMMRVFVVYRLVVPLGITAGLWLVMRRRFVEWDQRVRGATFSPRPPRRNIVVPEAFAP